MKLAALLLSLVLLANSATAQNPDTAVSTLETARMQEPPRMTPKHTAALQPHPDMPAAGINVPDGFAAMVVHEGVGGARHIIARPNPVNPHHAPDLYVAIRRPGGNKDGGTVALRDTTGDGAYDTTQAFGSIYGTGIDIRNGYLYRSSTDTVYRWKLPDNDLVPEGDPETIATGFPRQGQHAAKAFTFDASGHLYVDVGAPSNANQEKSRTPQSPGVYPADQLPRHGGIWRFDADDPGQRQMEEGERFATGLRHAVALEYNSSAGKLYMVMHGRDQLNTLWPQAYNAQENAELPAEEMHIINEGDNFGWPYSYWNPMTGERIIAPEYAWKFSDGQFKQSTDNPEWKKPIAAFPAHWAPNDLVFYLPPEDAAAPFPRKYHAGAFVAFHGSWNRAPKPQEGYNVAFQPLDAESGQPTGEWEKFATGFPGVSPVASPRDAEYRPMGLAVGPQGELYVVESRKGRIWRIVYTGDGK